MSIKLVDANRIIAAVFERAAELDCRPMSVIVVDPGCVIKAFQKEDAASMIRFEMAYGKAFRRARAGPLLEPGARPCRAEADVHAVPDRRQ